MAEPSTQVVDDLASLQAWTRQLRTMIGLHEMPSTVIQFPEFSDERNQVLTALANRFQSACGCASGGLFMSIVVIFLVVSFFRSGNALIDIGFANVIALLGAAVAATLVGKVLGLFWARVQLLRLAARMRQSATRDAKAADRTTSTQVGATTWAESVQK